MRHALLLGLFLVSPLYAQTKVEVRSEIAAAEAAAASGDTAQARYLYEAAIHKIDAAGYGTVAMDQLDTFRENILRRAMGVAAAIPDVDWMSQLAARLRREHPNGRGWVQASVTLAERTGQGAGDAQALLAQEVEADAAYNAAKQAYNTVKQLRKKTPGLPLPQEVFQQVRETVSPYIDGSCASSLRCRWLLATVLLDSGDLEQGAGQLAALGSSLLPAYGSMFNRTVRDKLFEIAIRAIERIANQEKALALCKAILAVQEGGNEQNLGVREREEAARARLLLKEVVLAAALNRQADMLEAVGKMQAWFPTDVLTVEANRIAAKAQGQDSSAWIAQAAAERQAEESLVPLLKNFQDWSDKLQAKGTDRQSATVGRRDCVAAIAHTAGQYQNTGVAINALVEVASRIRSSPEFNAQAVQMLSTAQSLLGKRTGWVAFKCCDAMSDVLLSRKDPAAVQYCDATLASDPLLFRRVDAGLKKAIATRRTRPGESIQYAENAVILLNEVDESVWRMVGWDSLALLKSNLMITQAMGLLKTEPAEATSLLTEASKDLQGVSNAYASSRDVLSLRAKRLRWNIANASGPRP